MNVILDTNIWISFLFGKRLHSVSSLFLSKDIHVYVSIDLVAELKSVLSRPKVREHVSQESIDVLWELIREYCYVIEEYPVVQSDVRDVKDVYLLSMAESIPADFLITGDNDLLVLQKHGKTRIVTYQDFQSFLLIPK